MTVLVVQLETQKIGDGGGVVARRQLREAEKEEHEERPETS